MQKLTVLEFDKAPFDKFIELFAYTTVTWY